MRKQSKAAADPPDPRLRWTKAQLINEIDLWKGKDAQSRVAIWKLREAWEILKSGLS